MQRVNLDGFTMVLHGDNYLEEKIVKTACWEPDTTAVFRQLLRPGMVVLDIGANIGYFSLLSASRVGLQGQVHAFEPYPGYQERFRKSLECNQFPQIRLIPFALSDKNEEHHLHKGLASARMHKWTHDDPVFNQIHDTVTVRCMPLDDYAGRTLDRVDLIKIDVDGYEMRVLKGAAQTIKKYRPVIIIELYEQALKDAGSSVAQLLDLFKELNYTPYSEKGRAFSYEQLGREAVLDPERSLNIVFQPVKKETHIELQTGADKLKAGFVLDVPFHEAKTWTNATTPYLVEAIRSVFDCTIIQSQSDYENAVGQLDVLISMEPQWGGHRLNLTRTSGLREQIRKIPSYLFCSDPHATQWRQDYFLENAFDYFLSFYYHPMRYHFRKIPPECILHFPWAIPDAWIGSEPIALHHQQKIACFGGVKSKAYTLRNWCRQFDFVESSSNSGCENKVMSDAEYIQWLGTKDACIAAGSDDPIYRLTVPKYFEIASAGALVLAQETDDLGLLGFVHDQNCLVFNRDNFEQIARRYLAAPSDFLDIRRQGRELIRRRHSLSVRMANLMRHVQTAIQQKTASCIQISIPAGTTAISEPTSVSVENVSSEGRELEKEFARWFKNICIPSVLAESDRGLLEWEGVSLQWDACHEILAYHTFINGAVPPEKLIAVSNRRYELLDQIWPAEPITQEKVENFYRESAKILPWGHGIFMPDHNVQQRRRTWLKRVKLLEMLKERGVHSVCDYGAGGGHTSLLAMAMGFSRVIHHEYSVFHPYIAWRQKQIQPCDVDQQFILTAAEEPLRLDEPVDAVICMDVAEHVWDPARMLRDIHAALKPGGYLVWNSVFGEGIKGHLHPQLKDKEEQLLKECGFERVGDLTVDCYGHSGLYQSVAVPSTRFQTYEKPQTVLSTVQPERKRMTVDELLERNQWLGRDELDNFQWKMLKLLLDHAYRNVPFYRQYFEAIDACPGDIRTMDDFQRLPIVRKSDIQQHLESMRAANFSDDRVLRDATGGSTGQPLVFYRDFTAREWLLAASRRFRQWMGYDSTSKLALIWGADRDIPTTERPHQRWLNAFDCSEQDIERFMAELVDWKPDAIRAYSSSMAMVASYMAKKGIPAPRPGVIECAAEKLWDHQRKQIEDVFGCPVYEMYGSRELPALACECEHHQGMHIFSDIRLIETINNGLPAESGQEGSLIMTDLVNYGMPLIRYEIGDVGVISHSECACGRKFPLLTDIKGRISSTILAPDGRRIHGEYFTHLFYQAPGIQAFQVHQKSIDDISILIQPAGDFQSSVIEKIVATVSDHMGEQVNVKWTCLDQIPVSASGKQHFTISDVPVDYCAVDTTVSVQQAPAPQEHITDRPRILFIVDRPGWAHDFKTDNLIKQLSGHYRMEKAYCDHVTAEQIDRADLVLIYYWKQMRYENMQKLAPVLQRQRHKILMGICSHTELEGQWRKTGLVVLKEFAAGVFVNSKLLLEAFGKEFDVPVFYTSNGVDTTFFTPSETTNKHKKLIVGWAGSIKNNGDVRGYHDYIVPATEKLRHNVQLLTAAREEKWRNPEQMREFYRQLDLYICASRCEGTPNPCLEAMACGIPVLTTSVGNMPELVRPGVNGYFIERDVHHIVYRLKYLFDRPQFLQSLSRNARQIILGWDWEYKAVNYQKMFDKMLLQNNSIQLVSQEQNESDSITTEEITEQNQMIGPDDKVLSLFKQAQRQFALGNMVSAKRFIDVYKQSMDYDCMDVARRSSDKADPLFSVVMVTYNRPDEVSQCVETLGRQHCRDFEIVVVDNGHPDKKASALAHLVDVYVDCPTNFNLSEGRNIGAHFASGKILVMLDDDALVGPEYLDSIKRAFEQYEILGLRGRALPKDPQQRNQQVGIYDLGQTPCVTLCNQEGNSAFRRDAYLAVGGMDALLFGHEGTDITYRLMQHYDQTSAILYWPKTIIYHDYGDADAADIKKKRYERNRDYIRHKFDLDVVGLKDQVTKYPLVENRTGQLLPPLEAVESLPQVQPVPSISVAGGPKVTIIMACHNAASFLAETMDSILNQTLTDWELLVTDDGSTDQTRDILTDYAQKDQRIRLRFFDDQKGPYIRRNFSITQARAPFISIQDADDIMAPNKLLFLYEAICSDEKLAIVGSHYRRFLDVFRGEDFGDRMQKRLTHQDLMTAFPGTWHLCWHGSAIIRKSLFDTIGYYDEQPYGSDTFWLSKAGLYGLLTNRVKFKNLPEFLTYKREHAQSQTGKISPIDPRCRRHRLERYYLQKLQQIKTQAQANTSLDVAQCLKACTCTDFIPQFGHLFDQWESAPIDRSMIQSMMNRGLAEFYSEHYVSALLTFDCLSRMVPYAAASISNFNLVRGLALYATGDDQQARDSIQKEIQLSGNQNAKTFLDSYIIISAVGISAARRRENVRKSIMIRPQQRPVRPQSLPEKPVAAQVPETVNEKLANAKGFLDQGNHRQAVQVYRELLSDNAIDKHSVLKKKLHELVTLIDTQTAENLITGPNSPQNNVQNMDF